MQGRRRSGIEARRKFVEPVGAWFSQVGRLHQVHHLWQYPDLATRKETREKAWQVDGWAETVSKVSRACLVGAVPLLIVCADVADGKVYGLFHNVAPALQPPQMIVC